MQPHQLRFLSTSLFFGTMLLLVAVLSGEEQPRTVEGAAPIAVDASNEVKLHEAAWLKADAARLAEISEAYKLLQKAENDLLVANRVGMPEAKVNEVKHRLTLYSNKQTDCAYLSKVELKEAARLVKAAAPK